MARASEEELWAGRTPTAPLQGHHPACGQRGSCKGTMPIQWSPHGSPTRIRAAQRGRPGLNQPCGGPGTRPPDLCPSSRELHRLLITQHDNQGPMFCWADTQSLPWQPGGQGSEDYSHNASQLGLGSVLNLIDRVPIVLSLLHSIPLCRAS